MDQPPYGLDASRRNVVLTALRQRCQQQQWTLLAAYVRINDVHIEVDAEVRPERIMEAQSTFPLEYGMWSTGEAKPWRVRGGRKLEPGRLRLVAAQFGVSAHGWTPSTDVDRMTRETRRAQPG